jgi:hypothetical protein
MHPQPVGTVPEDTALVAKAAFPKGNLYMQMRDVLGTIYDDEDFSHRALPFKRAAGVEFRGSPADRAWLT